MAVYTHLTPDEIGAFLAAYGMEAPTDQEAIPAGSINTNYFVVVGRERFFLRLNEVASPEELRYEAELLRHLRAKGTPTPELLRTKSGAWFAPLRGKLGSLFRFVPGMERSAATVTIGELQRLGSALGRIHRATAGFPLRRPHAFDLPVVSRWVGELAAIEREDLADTTALLQEELTYLHQHRDRGLVRGVIHGDLFPDNVKWDEIGEINLLFDFEMASDGALAYDVAVCINAWCFDRSFDWSRVRALLHGYQKVRPITEAEAAGLGAELRLSALRFTVTRIRDFHLRPVPEGDRVEKDFRDYRERLVQLRALSRAQLYMRLFG